MLAEILLGFVASELMKGKTSPTAPLYRFPPAGGAPYAPPAPSPAPRILPAPSPSPSPAPAPAPAPAPPFPTEQIVPPPEPVSGSKKAVELWVLKPALVASGVPLSAVEAQFPIGWQSARSVTADEIATARGLLSQWREGGVLFLGPPTLAGRRAYRMTKHPGATAPAPAPARAPAPRRATGLIPDDFPPPAVTPAAAPARSPTPATEPTPPPATPNPQGLRIVTVRRGEGLANIAKRLGRPATAASAAELRAANIPQGPDNQWRSAAMEKGGIARKGYQPGLRPGDRLYIPAEWGINVDA